MTVTRPLSLLLAGVCGVIAYAGAVRAADTLPDRRAVRPVARTTATGNDAVLDLLNDVEDLKAQVRRLRGQIEVQQHELDQLKNGQRQSLIDLDRRLSALERRPAGASATPGPSQSATATPPPLAPAGSAAVATIAPSQAGPRAAPSAAEQQQYDAAFALMKQGLYQQAAARFREFIARNPKSALADNAQYWIGEAAYVTRDFRTALEEFNKVVTNYPQSPKVPDALLKIGYTHYELAAYARAREVLNEVISRYPNTAVAKSAELRLERIAKEGN